MFSVRAKAPADVAAQVSTREAWITSKRYSDESLPLEAIFEELHVESLLLGTLSIDGGFIHGNLSLVDREGFQVWAMDYREPVDEIFTIQRKIALPKHTDLVEKLGVLGGHIVGLLIPRSWTDAASTWARPRAWGSRSARRSPRPSTDLAPETEVETALAELLEIPRRLGHHHR